MTNPPTSEIGDRELVSRAQAGELDAFETLTTRYEQRVYSLARRMLRQEQDAEDVTQQTFLSALENLNGFRGEASFATWLFRIATHAALKVIRKRKGLKTVSLEEATEERTAVIPFRIRNSSPIGGSLRNNWFPSGKFNVCWTKPCPGWTKNTGSYFSCVTWKGYP